MRVLFMLAGLHHVQRGAEVVFESVAAELARTGDEVTLIGSGYPRPDDPYRFLHIARISRERFERWPTGPVLRHTGAYEGLTAVPSELFRYRPADYDVTVTCGYPFENWLLRRPRWGGPRPAHVFVTQNGDWPATADHAEYRWFSCDGLICTNPDYLERNRDRWNCALVPNGVDPNRFAPGRGDRSRFGIATDRPVVLMVSALEENKRVLDGMRAVAALDDVAMVVAGDGPLRTEVDRLAAEILPDRFLRLTVDKTQMPELYRCADVFLHTTKAESFGNVYIEALASGLPVVAHDATTTRWILGDQARLIDTEHHEQTVEALRGALADGHEGGAAQAHQALTRFSWSSIASQYRSHFESAIAARRRG